MSYWPPLIPPKKKKKPDQLPDLVIDLKLLDEIAHQASVINVIPPSKLSHKQHQALIHLRSLEQLLKDYGIQPNFTVDV